MHHARRIVLALGDAAEARLVAALLEGEGLVVQAPPGMPALRALLAGPTPEIKALLVDAGFEGHDGAALCAELRRAGFGFPVLVLHDRDDGAVVRCLDAGANDCLARPLRPRELAARLRAQLRQHDGSAGAELELGPYRFRPARRALQDASSGRIIRLTATEATILRVLYRAGGAPVPRAVLLNEVWGYRPDVNTHTVETHIYRLRRKIEPDPGERRLVLSSEAGYRLNLGASFATWAGQWQEESSFSEQKEAKRLYSLASGPLGK